MDVCDQRSTIVNGINGFQEILVDCKEYSENLHVNSLVAEHAFCAGELLPAPFVGVSHDVDAVWNATMFR